MTRGALAEKEASIAWSIGLPSCLGTVRRSRGRWNWRSQGMRAQRGVAPGVVDAMTTDGCGGDKGNATFADLDRRAR
jgi:hypothetical protein